jgi:hypothetical protein
MTGFEPVQMPVWQLSACVHALLSLHVVPLAALGFVQMPVDVLQTPATWHVSSAVQVTGFVPLHVPARQLSVCVHALPSLHVVPSVRGVHAESDVPGTHCSQAFAGLIVPDGYAVPPMMHVAPHEPPTHCTPPPQFVPSGSVGCVHVPIPSHVSEEQALPSSVHVVPVPLLTMVQLPLPSHVDDA